MGSELDQRREWARHLLNSLSDENTFLADAARGTQETEDPAIAAARQEAEEKRRARQARHAEIIEALKQGLANRTAVTNEFHSFREDTQAQRRWSYPFQLMKRGRETNRKLLQEREQMNALMLQQRLLEEEIRRLSDSVSRDALVRLKQAGPQSAWMGHLARRQQIIDDLLLLLPAIPETARCAFDPASPQQLLELLA